jgi:hypothetical protein
VEPRASVVDDLRDRGRSGFNRNSATIFRSFCCKRRSLPTGHVPADIEHWTARVAELERELDAAAKLSEVRVIAGELMRTRAALKEARAKTGSAGQRPKRGTSRRSGRRSASTAPEPASS